MKLKLPSTKTDYVYNTLKQNILKAKIAPGSRLRLAELAATYDLSEMPIREALRMLQRDGLVVFESHRGATVVELSTTELYEMIATRTYLEIMAISEALPNYNGKGILEMEVIVDRMHNNTSAEKYKGLNEAFHRALYEPCRNSFLKREIEDLRARVWQRSSKSLFELLPSRQEPATKEHEAILAAVKSGKADAVEKAARAHREATLHGWQQVIAETEASGGQYLLSEQA